MQLRAQAEKVVFGQIQKSLNIFALKVFQANLKKLRYGIAARESMRLQRTRSFGVFRALYSEIGVRWAGRQLLDNERDIFYLTESEIEDYFYGKSFVQNLKPVVALRKATAQTYRGTDLPGALELSQPPSEILPENKKTLENQSPSLQMAGIGCYPGQVTAPICRMPELDATKNVDGHILATVRTDPGWAPLFPRIRGLLVERGSRLSHSAIVARELGLPTVVNLPNLMSWIKDSEVVTVNGETGLVTKDYGTQRNADITEGITKDSE